MNSNLQFSWLIFLHAKIISLCHHSLVYCHHFSPFHSLLLSSSIPILPKFKSLCNHLLLFCLAQNLMFFSLSLGWLKMVPTQFSAYSLLVLIQLNVARKSLCWINPRAEIFSESLMMPNKYNYFIHCHSPTWPLYTFVLQESPIPPS